MRERDDVERPIFSSLLFRERMEAVAGYVLGCVHFDLSHPILHVFKGLPVRHVVRQQRGLRAGQEDVAIDLRVEPAAGERRDLPVDVEELDLAIRVLFVWRVEEDLSGRRAAGERWVLAVQLADGGQPL